MEPKRAFGYYLTLKKHFTDEKYDLKKIGKITPVAVSDATYDKVKNRLYRFNKFAANNKPDDVIRFLVANFVNGDAYGGLYSMDGEDVYKVWKSRIESVEYLFKKDVANLLKRWYDTDSMDLEEILKPNGGMPYVLSEMMGNRVEFETALILDKLYKWCDNVPSSYDNAWRNERLLLQKYSPFVRVDLASCKNIFEAACVEFKELRE